MPVISSMGCNAAAQAMSVAIRGITHGRTDRKLLHHVLARETIVGMLSGVVIGITTAIIALILAISPWPRVGTGGWLIAIMITQTLACVSGAAIPFVMRRLGFDPGSIRHDLRHDDHGRGRLRKPAGISDDLARMDAVGKFEIRNPNEETTTVSNFVIRI